MPFKLNQSLYKNYLLTVPNNGCSPPGKGFTFIWHKKKLNLNEITSRSLYSDVSSSQSDDSKSRLAIVLLNGFKMKIYKKVIYSAWWQWWWDVFWIYLFTNVWHYIVVLIKPINPKYKTTLRASIMRKKAPNNAKNCS